MAPQDTSAPRLTELESTAKQAQELELSIEAERIKREVKEFFAAHTTLADVAPPRMFRPDHESTEDLLVKLGAARRRILSIQRVATRVRTRAKDHLEDIKRFEAARADKREAKGEAIALITKADKLSTLGIFRQYLRTEHAPSETIVIALKEVRAIAVHASEADGLLARVAPHATKSTLKTSIVALLQDEVLGDLRPRTLFRPEHAAMDDLREALASLLHDLDAFAPESGGHDAALARLDKLIDRVKARKQAKQKRDETVAKWKRMDADFEKELEHHTRFHTELERKRKALDEQIAETLRAFDPIRERATTEQARLLDPKRGLDLRATLRSRHAQLELVKDYEPPAGWLQQDTEDKRRAFIKTLEQLPELQDATPLLMVHKGVLIPCVETPQQMAAQVDEIRRQVEEALAHADTELAEVRAALEGLQDEELALVRKLDRLERELSDLVDLLGFCADNIANIKAVQARSTALWTRYKNVKALVFYFGVNDDIAEKLEAIGSFIRGGRREVDAMGAVELVLVFDAGVRAGVDLGVAKLQAEVQLTLVLSGKLAVLDSRELMFSHRLALYLSASAAAELKKPDVAPELPGDLFDPPEILAQAAVSCRCTLYNVEACHVYRNEGLWSAHWCDAVARRIAFLRRVDVSTDKSPTDYDPRWVETELALLLQETAPPAPSQSQGPNQSPSPPEPDYRKMLKGRVAALKLLERFPPSELEFRGTDVFEGEATAQVLGRSASVGQDTRRRATFELRKLPPDGPVPRSAPASLGRLEEDSVVFKVSVAEDGAVASEGKKDEADEPKATLVTNPGARGLCIHHRWTPVAPIPAPPGMAREIEYVEVLVQDPHRITEGEITLEKGGTRRDDLQGASTREQRLAQASAGQALGQVLELAKPGAGKVGEFDQPGLIEMDADEKRELSTTSVLRLSLLMSKGHLHEYKKRLQRLEQRRKALQAQQEDVAEQIDKAEKTEARASAQLQRVRDTVRDARLSVPVPLPLPPEPAPVLEQVAAKAKEVLGAVKDLNEAVGEQLEELGNQLKPVLKNTGAAQMRWLRTYRVQRVAGHLVWSRPWVAQLYRGVSLGLFSFKVSHSVPIVPGVSAFFAFQFKFKSQSLQFELLGLGSFAYLKGLFNSFQEDGGWEEYLELHTGELTDLCTQVAEVGSTAFSEVVVDGLYGTSEKAAAARFGDVCYRVFRPELKSPFEALSEASVLEAFDLLRRGQVAAPVRGDHRVVDDSQVPIPIPISVPNLSVTDKEVRVFGAEHMSKVRSALWLSETINKRAGAWEAVKLLGECRSHLMDIVSIKRDHAPRIGGGEGPNPHELRCGFEEHAILMIDDALKAFEAFHKRHTTRLNAARGLAPEPIILALQEELAALIALDGAVRKTGGLLGLMSDADQRGRLLNPFTECLDRLDSVLHQETRVPRQAYWGARSQVFMLARSDDTRRLDQALASYHQHLGELWLPDTHSRHSVNRAWRLMKDVYDRRRLAVHLAEALDQWAEGRDLASSARGPRVCWFLWAPTRLELVRLNLAASHLELSCVIAEHQHLLEELEDTLRLQRNRLAAKDLFRAASQSRKSKVASAMARGAVFEHKRREDRAYNRAVDDTYASELAKYARRVQDEREAHERLVKELLTVHLREYLRATASQRQYDALLHGQRKQLEGLPST